MKLEWDRETFGSGLELTTTQFRGLFVEIRREPGESDNVVASIRAVKEGPVLDATEYTNLNDAMITSLKIINHYWDQMENGPDVEYKSMDLPKE